MILRAAFVPDLRHDKTERVFLRVVPGHDALFQIDGILPVVPAFKVKDRR